MRRYLFLSALLSLSLLASAQVAINTDGSAPNPSAMLDIKSTSKGILIPRVSSLSNIINPSEGLLVYDLNTNYFYFYRTNQWVRIITTNDLKAPAGTINFRAYKATGQSIPAHTLTNVTFDGQSYVTPISAVSSTAFVAPAPGLYQFTVNLFCQSTVNATVDVYIFVNGQEQSFVRGNLIFLNSNSSFANGTVHITDNLQLKYNDAVSVKVYTSNNVDITPDIIASYFTGFLIF